MKKVKLCAGAALLPKDLGIFQPRAAGRPQATAVGSALTAAANYYHH